MTDSPRLSVVVAMAERGRPFLGTWTSFVAQAGDEIEVVLVHAAPLPAVTTDGSLRCVECEPGTSVPRLRAAGVRAARGSIVALTEAFCRPAPGWARALLDARERTDALAIGGPVSRTRGGSAHWALTLVEYGRFLREKPDGIVDDLPLTNVSYQRRRLLEVLSRAPGGLDEEFAEPYVHRALLAAGEKLWRASKAVMFDDNDLDLVTSAHAIYHHGRLFGGRRVKRRSRLVKLLRCALSPLVPPVQLWRITGEARAAGRTGLVVRCFPQLVVLLTAWALGEGVGSLLGEGDSAARWS